MIRGEPYFPPQIALLSAIALGDIPYTGFLCFVGTSPIVAIGRHFVRPIGRKVAPLTPTLFNALWVKMLIIDASGDAWFSRLLRLQC